jgi:hypothetical protein
MLPDAREYDQVPKAHAAPRRPTSEGVLRVPLILHLVELTMYQSHHIYPEPYITRDPRFRRLHPVLIPPFHWTFESLLIHTPD